MRHRSLLLICVLASLCLQPHVAKARGFCDGQRNCTEAPWHFPEQAFYAGYAVNQGFGRWEHSLLLGVRSLASFPVPFMTRRIVLESGILHATNFLDANANVGSVVLRIGIVGQHFGITVGAKLLYATPTVLVRPFTIVPMDTVTVYPSLRAIFRFGAFATSVSLFDQPDFTMLRVALHYGSYGIAFSAYYGVEVFGRFAIAPTAAIETRAYMNWIDNTFSTGLLIGILLGQGTVYDFYGGRRKKKPRRRK